MDVTAWSNASEHNLLYAGWESSLGDYLSLKVPGNSTSGHGNLIIGDNGLWFGRMNATDSAQATDSNTNPHSGSGSNYFRVSTAGQLQVSGSVVSPIYYDTGGTTNYLDLGNTGTSLKVAGTVHGSNSNMSSYQLNGTYVMDSSRNLVNIGTITASGVVNIANNLSLTGDSRILNLAGGSTTNSQSRVIIGEQGTYGVSFRWNSGSDLEFDGFWNSSVTGSRNRDLGSVDVNNRRWNFENTVVVGGSVTAGSFVKSGGTSSQFLMADGSVSTGGGTATTINNNADNRVITGSGTADTLEAESGLTFDGDILEITGSGTTTKRLKVSPGTDYGRAHIGRAALGKLGFDDHAGFSHEDHNSQTNYALLQSNTANTYVNAASGKAGYLRINNSTIGYWNANGLHVNKYFDSNDTAYYIDPASTTTSANLAGGILSQHRKECSVSISNSYVRIFHVGTTTSQLASIVRVTGTSHGNSHVGAFTAEIIANHSQDVKITSSCGNYTRK